MLFFVKRNSALSRMLHARSDIKLGSCVMCIFDILTYLFTMTVLNLFITTVIVQLRQLSGGCYFGTDFVGGSVFALCRLSWLLGSC